METERAGGEYLKTYVALHVVGLFFLALAFSSETKREALQRANHCCEDCNTPLVPGNRKIHHIEPQHVRVDDSLDNAAALCKPCEAQRHYERWLEFGNPHDLNASKLPRPKGSPKAGKNRRR